MQHREVRKSNRQSNAGLLLVFVVVLIIIVACSARSVSLYHKSKELSVTQAQLEQQLEDGGRSAEQAGTRQ